MKCGRQWKSMPESTAHRRDFYRVHGEGISSETAEQMLGSIEDKAAPLIRQVIESQILPQEKEKLEVLLYFVALLATRIPGIRESIDSFFDEIAHRTLELSVATPERWESLLCQMRKSGYTKEQPSYENARRMVEKRGVRFSMSKNWQIGQMFRSASVVFPTLMKRTWCLLLSESGNLISSDRPITIVFTEPGLPCMSPGFGLNHTEVTVPLSKHVLLRGVWGKQPEYAVPMNREIVSHYNTLRLLQADRFLFSTAQEFPWLDNNLVVHNGLAGLQQFLQFQDVGE
jgi:hypothetical protein